MPARPMMRSRLAPINGRCGHFGFGADDERVIVAELLDQLSLGHAVGGIDFKAWVGAQIGDPLLVNSVGD